MKLRYLFLALACALVTYSAQAQLVVESTLTVEELVNDVLLGEGVTATNITYNDLPGDSVHVQVGTFNSENSNVPIDEGVIMASGNIQVAVGPNTGDGSFDGTGYTSTNGDADLEQLTGNTIDINDVAIIEFDFVATADSLRFNYVFASEEYENYVCCSVNDAFGFFLSGPGITGTFSNDAINVALVPGGEVPVTINTVNDGGADCAETNCSGLDANWMDNTQFYVDNPPGLDPNQHEFEGSTVLLTALSDIECGGEYHIKLAIGDGGDNIFDSAVFLEAGSFAAFGEVFVNVDPVIGGVTVSDPQYDDVIVAGCSEVGVELVRPDGLPVDSVFIEFGGSAIEGEDYELGENDTLFFFPQDIDTLNFEIFTLYDGVPDENEEIIISVIWKDGCGEPDTATATIPFVDPYILESFTENVDVICPADMTQIGATASNGINPYEYNWGDFGTGANVSVPVPDDEEYYVVQITDACVGVVEPILDSVLVTNSIPPPLQAGIAPIMQPECPNEPISLDGIIADGNPPYTIIWTDDQGNGYPQNESIIVDDINQFVNAFNDSLQVDFTIVDSCATTVTDSLVIVYPLPDSISVTYPPLTDNCPDRPVELTATSTGGSGENQFTWTFLQGADRGAEFDPPGANTGETINADFAGGMNELQVLVTDKCNRRGHDMVGVIIEEGQQTVYSTGQATHVDSVPVIKLDPLPNVITPNGDRFNDVFVVDGIDTFDNARLEIYDRWGKLVFETNNYEVGSPEQNPMPVDAFNGEDLSEGTYFYVLNIDNGECTQSGQLELLRSDN